MNPASAYTYIKKAHKAISRLNRDEGRRYSSAFYSYVDFFWCFIRYGCLINQYVNGNFWRYRHTDRKKIMTYRRVVEFIEKLNSSEHIYKLNDKVAFNRHFKDFIGRKWLSSEEMTADDFRDLCISYPEIIIKPLDECEGKGIELITVSQDMLSDKEFVQLYESLKKRRLIIEQRLKNHPEIEFNNSSINTIRINSITDKSGKVHIFKPVLRAGVGDSVVDNYNAGGCEYAIDAESGIVTSLCYRGYKLQGIRHPGCDRIMLGYQIPLWHEVIDIIERASHHIPECRFIGWDVAITPNGVQLIEGNHNPGNVSIEFFGEIGWYDKLKKYL